MAQQVYTHKGVNHVHENVMLLSSSVLYVVCYCSYIIALIAI